MRVENGPIFGFSNMVVILNFGKHGGNGYPTREKEDEVRG